MATISCSHCLLKIPERDTIRDNINGRDLFFCCRGCQGVYRLIHEEGLDEFYQRRSGWIPGPPENAEVTTGLFADAVEKADDGTMQIDVALSGIRCASCIWLIERYLARRNGITGVSVNYATHRARIRWMPDTIGFGEILRMILSLGYAPHPIAAGESERILHREKTDLLIRFGTASFLSMQLMLFTGALYAGYFEGIDPFYKRVFELISLIIATPVVFYCGYPFLSNTVRAVRNRSLTMDVLIFSGSFSAYGYSIFAIFSGGEVYFDTAAMIITLVLLGRFMEAGAKIKAVSSISALISLQPKEALVVESEREGLKTPLRMPVSNIQPGDVLEVIPGEKVPLDGRVIEGTSEVDESLLTGESLLVKKEEGAAVLAGTLNINGRLLLEVERGEKDSVLSQVIKAVEEAQARRAPIQNLADRVVSYFVPAVTFIAFGTFFFWFLRGAGAEASLMTAVSVLVIACPCALGLATPLAVLIGSSRLSSKGILVRGGEVIEAVARADFVSFDKTGTLTAGRPDVIAVVPYNISEAELRRYAASLERCSEHTIASSLRIDVRADEFLGVENFTAFPGRGVEGIINGEICRIGNPDFLRSNGVLITSEQGKSFEDSCFQGKTVVGLSVGGNLRGWFVLSDTIRPEAMSVVSALQQKGYGMNLLTGDNEKVAEQIGRQAGITLIEAGILPVQKAEKVQELRQSGHRVIMVGDGVNDAPALAAADVGVAIGGATDVAIESAGVTLMRKDLSLLLLLIIYSRRTLTVIRQNLFWAFSYNLVALPLAVSGKIHPIFSALFMTVSSLIVVGNSLRLYRMKG